MQRLAIAILIAATVLTLTGCSRHQTVSPVSTGASHVETAAASDASPTPPPVPLTGIPSVDEIIRLEVAGDVPALLDHVGYTSVQCSFHAANLDGVPSCQAGETEGQLVDTFFASRCELAAERPDQARRELVQEHLQTELYAVEHGSAVSAVSADYVVSFANVGPPDSVVGGGFSYAIRGDKIVGKFGACPYLTASPPLVPLIYADTSGAPHTEIAPIDEIVTRALAGDSEALVSRLSYASLPCVSRQQEGSPPQCPTGRNAGDEVPAFLEGGCGGNWVPPQDAERIIRGLRRPARLFAIGTPSGQPDFRIDTRVLFAYGDDDQAPGFFLDVRGGRIIAHHTTCGSIRSAATFAGSYFVPPPP